MILRVLVVLMGVVGLAGCNAFRFEKVTEENLSVSQEAEMPAGELQIEEVQVGEGAEAKAGDMVKVHYTGWLTDGTKFDSSVDRGEPFAFELGAGQVIQGWDQGVVGMKVGSKRKLTIPPDLAYGSGGFGRVIPPNATLKFEVELVEIAESGN